MVTVQNEVITTFKTIFDSSSKAAADSLSALSDVASAMSIDMRAASSVMKDLGLSIGKNNRFYQEGRKGMVGMEEVMNQLSSNGVMRMDTLFKAADNLGTGIGQVEKMFEGWGYTVQDNGDIFDRTKQKTISFNDAVKTTRSSFGRFRAELLSVMFILMGLQRVLSQFYRSAITTFQKANEDTEGLGKSTWHLQAAWEFFKYSLIDALTSSDLFRIFIQMLLDIVKWFNKLKPGTKAIIAIGLALLLISIPLALIIVQFMILAATMNISFVAAIGMVAKLLLGVILIIVGLGIMIYGIIGIVKNWGKDWGETIKFVGWALLGLSIILIGIAIIIGSWPLAMVAAIVAIVALVAFGVSWIIKHWQETQKFLEKLWMWMKIGWQYFWAFLKILFVRGLQLLVNYWMTFAEAFAWIIDGMRIAWVYLTYAIKKVFQSALSWLLSLFTSWIEGILSWVEKIPGIGKGIASGVRSALNTAKGAVDAWGQSIEDSKNAALSEIKDNGAVAQVKELRDLANEAFDNKVEQIIAERDIAIQAAKDEYAEKAKLLDAEAKAREEANRQAQEANKSSLTPETPGLGGMDLKSILGGKDLLNLGAVNGTSPVDNSSKEYNDYRTLNFSGLSKEEVLDLLEEDRQKTIDELNRTNDSALS